jgi:hypothetical protein
MTCGLYDEDDGSTCGDEGRGMKMKQGRTTMHYKLTQNYKAKEARQESTLALRHRCRDHNQLN